MGEAIGRRDFLRRSLTGLVVAAATRIRPAAAQTPWFEISLAEWSYHRSLRSGALDHLDFALIARRDHAIDGVEYVNRFFFDKARDAAYLREMKTRADGEGVRSLLVMCDEEGRLGAPDAKERRQAVENHYKWADAAATLGCHAIRVNAHGEGTFDEQMKLVADGLRSLCEAGAERHLDVLVENHGGLSSNGRWLVGVMQAVDHPRCGTLPDFGNFGDYGGFDYNEGGEDYDRYQGVRELMPFAKAVSAKSHSFDEQGNESQIDYRRMLDIVLEAGYRGWVGIEYGAGVEERQGIDATKRLLERIRLEYSPL